MPTKAALVATRLRADAAWVAIFTGGTYLQSDLGVEGIGDASTPDAYANGVLKPAALVSQRVAVPTFQIRDSAEQVADASQVVEIYLYQMLAIDAIEAGLSRALTLLEGKRLTATHKLEWILDVGILPEPGNLGPGVQMARTDYQVTFVRKGS